MAGPLKNYFLAGFPNQSSFSVWKVQAIHNYLYTKKICIYLTHTKTPPPLGPWGPKMFLKFILKQNSFHLGVA